MDGERNLTDRFVPSKSKPGRPGAHVHLLVMIGGGVREFDLPYTGTPFLVGRIPSAHIFVDAASVSRKHAWVIPDGGSVFVRDEGSTNGTFVNNTPVGADPVEVKIGDAIRFGDVVAQLRSATAGVSPGVAQQEVFDRRVVEEAERCIRYDRSLAVVSAELLADADTRSDRAVDLVIESLRSLDVVTVRKPGRLDALIVECSKDEAGEIADRIAQSFANDGIQGRLGVATYPGDVPHAGALLAGAESAMHEAEAGTVSVATGGSRMVQLEEREVIVAAPAMVRLFGLIERVASAPVPVLVHGETGTGKEIVAEAIHAMGDRASAPMVKLNCAALPEQLLESELYGHEAGAFSGAGGAKPGLFEEADGGTLFLDEIGEMSQPLQAKLLRVLEDGKVRRVGATREIDVDVRIVAATHRDLKTAALDGRFRQDLYYRLSGVVLDVPPLRERSREVPLLAERFALDICRQSGLEPVSFSADAINAMLSYDWPGNIRELRNAVNGAVLVCEGEVVDLHDLPKELAEAVSRANVAVSTEDIEKFDPTVNKGPKLAEPRTTLEEKLRNVTKRYIAEALAECGGNQTQAAKVLGISRRTLVYKISSLGIDAGRRRRPTIATPRGAGDDD